MAIGLISSSTDEASAVAQEAVRDAEAVDARITAYEGVRSPEGELIGMLYVGLPLDAMPG